MKGNREGKREDKSETFSYVIIIFVFKFLVFFERAYSGPKFNS